ncbi:MAG: response regulator transcription factor [Verrucomicrobiae bacterium]|nr:response regulator transcription factor [Verrucomicrobiae bacterium]
MKTKIILVDDHKVVLEGLHALLEQQHDMTVVAEADDSRIAVQKAKELQPNIVLMDVAMPGLNGIEATRQITSENRQVKVIVLSMLADRRTVAKAFGAGAMGYVLKECASRDIIQAIRTVMGGHVYMSSQVAGIVVEDYVQNMPRLNPSALPILSAREQEILQLLAEGQSSKETASTLHLSVKTVDAHRKKIMDKLAVNSVAELVKYAIREGLTSLE